MDTIAVFDIEAEDTGNILFFEGVYRRGGGFPQTIVPRTWLVIQCKLIRVYENRHRQSHATVELVV